MHEMTGATSADIRPASLTMWESYDYVRDKEDKDFFYRLLIREPAFDPEQLRLLKVGDQIAATVMIARRGIYDGCEYQRLGGIGNVAVHPDFRGEGFSKLLLNDAVEYMQGHGYDISTLYTGHEGLYEKVGYQRIAGRGQVTGRIEGVQLPLQRTKDWKRAKTLYEAGIAHLPGANGRTDEYWERFLGDHWLQHANIVYSANFDAYVMIDEDPSANSVRIVDAGYADGPEQLESLFRNNFAGMELSSPSTDLSHPILQAIKAAATESSEVISCGLMVRSLGQKRMPSNFLDVDVDRF